MTVQDSSDQTGGAARGGRGAGEERVAVVLGDRLCVTCGFNQHGQPIVREPHYGMLAVRCPECSTLASLQEYPVLGRWGARIGLVFAVGWLLVVLLLAFLTGLTFYGASEMISAQATTPAARKIGLAFREYALANQEPAGSGTMYAQDMEWTINNEDAAYNWIELGWAENHDLREIASGSRIEWRALGGLVPFVLGAGAWGAVWAVLLLHRRLRGRLVITGAIVALVAAIVVVSHVLPADPRGGTLNPFVLYGYGWAWGVPAGTIASKEFGLPIALVVVAIGFGAMAAGLALGRKAARLVVRILLPPRLRGPLAVLWLVDGLPPPPTRAEFWRRG